MLATEVIKKKRSSGTLSLEELEFFILGYTKGTIPDYQMASLLMAIFLQGMNKQETIDLTEVMLNSGERIQFNDFLAVDKHSTGGVGDKTSLILAPLVAACGVPVPMMSGRGLGHTGGTLDKLESIPGFNVNQDLSRFKKLVNDYKLCFIGQTPTICPADKKIYALRDVTATVESLPLICASIMSKKIAEGIRGLVLDVKVGSGAFMKTLDEAKALAEGLMTIGKGHGLETRALITSMDAPLGAFVGNSLEVGECLAILKQESFGGRDLKDFGDTQMLSLKLAAQMVSIGLNQSLERSEQKVSEALTSGRAYELFEKICHAQGGDLTQLPRPSEKYEIFAEQAGFLNQINSEMVGVAGIHLGAGRKVQSDVINPSTGIEIHKKLGEKVSTGDKIFTLHFNSGMETGAAQTLLSQCFTISTRQEIPAPLIRETLS